MHTDVVIVGAGPAGLAIGACLKRLGIDALVLDSGKAIGDSWRARYQRLHLHSPRIQSALPGLRMPRRFGRWVAKDDVARYLEGYALKFGIEPEFSTEVTRVDRTGAHWTVVTNRGEVTARQVVVATGYSHTPVQPSWPGQHSFVSEVVHASKYQSAAKYSGLNVLVVGAGNTGAEIAADLVEHGASKVSLSIRTAPNIIPRQVGPIPTTLLAIPMDALPAWLVDPVNRLLQRVTLGDLTRFGMPAAKAGVVAQTRSTGVTPTIDVGMVAALRAGRVTPVASLDRFEGHHAILSDGTRLVPDAVIAATGYTTGLAPIVGHLGVLGERGIPLALGARSIPTAPGLRFVGLWNPLKGHLFQIGREAKATARAISRELL